MGHPKPILLLTRPEAQSKSFLADVTRRLGHIPSHVISPVLKIVPVAGSADLDAFRTIILTSGNAVAVLNEALQGRQVVTVGERTAELARAAGASAVCLGDRVEALIERLGEVVGPALHLRGRHSRGDIIGAGRSIGLSIEECVVYDQMEEPLSERAKSVLHGGSAVVPLFSPRSAALVAAYGSHEATQVFAMSDAVAAAWSGPTVPRIADRPDRTAMLDLVAAAF